MVRYKALVLALLVLSSGLARAGEDKWTEPKDGLFSEKEADTWIEFSTKTTKLGIKALQDLGALKEPTVAQIAAINTKLDSDTEAARTASGFSKPHLDWLGKVVVDTHLALWAKKKFQEDIDKAVKEKEDAVRAAEKTKAEIAAAKKAGRRVMTPEEKADAKTAADASVKEAAAALAEAQANTKAQKAALAQAQDALKKADADSKEGCQQAVTDATEAVKNAQTAEAEPAAALAVAKKRAADPDLPASPDDKAAIEADTASREQTAQEELDAATKARDAIGVQAKAATGQLDKQVAALPAANVAVVRPRQARIQEILELGLTVLGGKK